MSRPGGLRLCLRAGAVQRVTVALLVLAWVGALADAGTALAQTVDPDLLDDAGRIIGSPDAGPDPQNSGDRGGWAQLLTLAVMMAGVVFIAWRIRAALVRR